MSEPPNAASASNAPLVVVPKRVSTRVLLPPIATPGPVWQAAHETSLNTGPNPSAGVSAVANSIRPSVNASRSACVAPASGSPKSPRAAVATHTKPPNTVALAKLRIVHLHDGCLPCAAVCKSRRRASGALVAGSVEDLSGIQNADGIERALHALQHRDLVR